MQIGHVAASDKADGDDMVAEHLHMVTTTCLDMQHKDLLEPKCALRQVVELNGEIENRMSKQGEVRYRSVRLHVPRCGSLTFVSASRRSCG